MLSSDIKFADGESFAREIFRRLRLDPALILALIGLMVLGLVVLYSASGQSSSMLVRQGIRLFIGLIGLLMFAQVSTDQLRIWSPWLYAAGMICLALILSFGDVGKGAQRWLDLGFVRFQPSELMKLIVPMMMGWYLSARLLPPRAKYIIIATLIFMLPMGLIAKQPDLGTALLVGSGRGLVL